MLLVPLYKARAFPLSAAFVLTLNGASAQIPKALGTANGEWEGSKPHTSSRAPGYEIFEYSCHEGNDSMRNRLSAARSEEAKEAAKK